MIFSYLIRYKLTKTFFAAEYLNVSATNIVPQLQIRGLYYHIIQIVFIQRQGNGLHGMVNPVTGELALPDIIQILTRAQSDEQVRI